MPNWESYPNSYRESEIKAILSAVRAGECAALVGLSGSGKSNLLGYLANRVRAESPEWALVDCNRMEAPSLGAFFGLAQRALGNGESTLAGLDELESLVRARLAARRGRLCLLFDRFDALPRDIAPLIASNLRALRDTFKYELAYVVAARRPLEPQSELAELFFAHTLWLGPLSAPDAHWSAASYARRCGLDWSEETIQQLIRVSGGYPAWLRAACEALAAGTPPFADALLRHPAVQQRLAEFWADQPTPAMIASSRLGGIPLLENRLGRPPAAETIPLTAKEALLLAYLQAHAGKVCVKDDLIRAVWPEDRVFLKGVRDDSLAQLVRRLREKVEADPGKPSRILAVPGRGYRFID